MADEVAAVTPMELTETERRLYHEQRAAREARMYMLAKRQEQALTREEKQAIADQYGAEYERRLEALAFVGAKGQG